MEGADSCLQQEFKLTDWSEYAAWATTDSHINIDIYTNSVLEHINNCVDKVTSHKTIITFPNQKPWMNREVRLLLKARDAAFRSGDREAYSSARANLRKGISMAKHCYKQQIEEHFSSSDPRRMWQGIQTLTDYKPCSTVLANNCALLPDELNRFYARFDRGNKVISSNIDPPLHDHPLTHSTLDVRSTLSRGNVWSAAGPDGVPGHVLRACAHELSGVFAHIFNLPLAQAAVPTIFKTATIVPVPKHPTASAPNDFRPVALTPIISKCFERPVLSHLKSCQPATLDPHQFTYRSNRSTEDAIFTALHTALTHLDCQNSYVRMLFIDFSAAFNTMIPSKLMSKLNHLGISTKLCNWILDFLTDRPQSVKLDNLSSSFIRMNTGVPQGCVLSPILYSLFTHDCVPIYGSNTIIKYADDTMVIGLIRDNDETAYRDEVQHLSTWCHDNNLTLNTQKTKEILMDLRRSRSQAHPSVYISGAAVEQLTSFKFLGTHISNDLTWSLNSSVLVKKVQQHLYFLRSLKKVHLSPGIRYVYIYYYGTLFMSSALYVLLLFSALWTLSLCGTRHFHLVNVNKTWTGAQSYCRANFTDLATIESQQEMKALLAAVRGTGGLFWIGLREKDEPYRTVGNRSWTWSDGSNSSYSYWNTTQPSNAVGDNCVQLLNGSEYRWNDAGCKWPNPFICYEEAVPLILINQSKTWREALWYCRENHVDLVSVHTEEVQQWVEVITKNTSTANVWVGLRHTCAQSIWFWVSGWSICYQNWAPGNGTGVEDCSGGERTGAVQSGSKQWVSLPETQTLNFICSVEEF
ncbi:hypothetical protein NFI96_000178 [Prochilodus magdalenae]|nr:hypothetical protein NFI96_000178 [Prochilodus magdalenae]